MGLPAGQRLRSSRAFDQTVRQGRRAGSRRLVVHLFDAGPATGPAQVGFVVSKAVGTSVVRHRVTRQLRALARSRQDRLPSGGQVVVRALPPAARATSLELAGDLDRCLDRVLGRPAPIGAAR